MSDLVVTVPMRWWAMWIDEGDAVDEPETGEDWGFYLGPHRPPIKQGERLYIVAHGLVRGYAPVTEVTMEDGRWAIGRRGGAVAVTISEDVKGFRGHRRCWWDRGDERPFPAWEFARVPERQASEILMRHRVDPDNDGPGFFPEVIGYVNGWITSQARAGVVVYGRDLVPVIGARFDLEPADAQMLACWVVHERSRWTQMGRLDGPPIDCDDQPDTTSQRPRNPPKSDPGQTSLFGGES